MAETDKSGGGGRDSGAGFMKAVVIVLGVMLIAGFVVVFSTIIYRTVKLADDPAETDGTVETVAGEVKVPEGAQVGSMVLDGNRLAIHLKTPAGEEVVVIDVRRGEQLSRVRLVPSTEK